MVVTLDSHCYSLVRFFCKLIGLWPYSSTKEQLIKKLFICILSMVQTVYEIWLLIIASKDVDSVLSILTVMLTWIMAETMYLSCLPCYDTIKMLFLCISRDWVELKCTDDLNVLKKYTYDGCSYITLYAGLTIFSVCLLTVFVIIAAVFQEQFVSFNEHVKQTFPIVAQNMNSIEWSLFIIAFPTNTLILIIVMVAFDSIYMALVYHACGMLGVMSSRLEHLFDNIQLMNASDRNYLVRARFVNVVRYHWKCTEYIDRLDSCFTTTMFLQHFMFIIMFTSKLYQVIKCFKLYRIALLVIFMTDGTITFVTLFAKVFPLEKLADSGQLLFQSAYNAHWYEASPSIQKSFLFVIQNVSKSYYFGISGFFNTSFETCSKILQFSFSCFTVMLTLQI